MSAVPVLVWPKPPLTLHSGFLGSLIVILMLGPTPAASREGDGLEHLFHLLGQHFLCFTSLSPHTWRELGITVVPNQPRTLRTRGQAVNLFCGVQSTNVPGREHLKIITPSSWEARLLLFKKCWSFRCGNRGQRRGAWPGHLGARSGV